MKPALFVRSRHDVATRRSRGLRCRITRSVYKFITRIRPEGSPRRGVLYVVCDRM